MITPQPAKEAVALTNRTKLRRRLQEANVQCLASVSLGFNMLQPFFTLGDSQSE